MYSWKCWRDTRFFFIAFLIIGAAAVPFAAAIAGNAHIIDSFRETVFLPTVFLILFFVALGLGTLCAIQEFTEKTTHFLFTKPRSRTYFVWVAWSVGFIELMTITGVSLLAGWLALAHYGIDPFTSLRADAVKRQDIVGLFVYATFIYSLTYSLTAILRNGLKGLGAAMGILAILQSFAIAVRVRWNLNVPIPPLPIDRLPLLLSNTIWISVALLFVLAAQLVVEQAEV